MNQKHIGYYFFYSFCLAITLMIMLFLLLLGDGELGGPGPIILLFVPFQFCFVKLGQKSLRPQLNAENKKRMKWKNIGICFLIFNILIVATAVYLLTNEIHDSGDEVDKLFLSCFTVVFWLAGVMCIWLLTFQQLADGVEDFFKTYIKFVKERVSVYLLYRLLIFLFTILAGTIIINLAKNSFTAEFAAGTYFRYILDESLANTTTSGFLSGDGSFVGGLTAAASYFVLCEMVAEMRKEPAASLKKRILRMFFQKDTLWLLVMTVFCIIVTIMPIDSIFNLGMISQIGTPIFIFFTVCSIAWLISFISFVKGTKLVPYLVTYFSMTFVEMVLQMPENFFLGLIITILRILIFSMLAIIIERFNARTEYLQTQSKMNTAAKIETKVNNATVGNVIIGTVKTINTVKNAPANLKNASKNKIKNLFK